MKVTDIIIPKILNYYSCSSEIYLFTNCLTNVKIYELEDNTVNLILNEYNDTIIDNCRIIMGKSQLSTAGNQYVYEYELGYKGEDKDIYFVITTSKNYEIQCKLISIRIDKDNIIDLTFERV